MSVEAFVWFYKEQDVEAIGLDEVFSAFGIAVASWTPDTGLMQLEFGGPADTCEAYLHLDPADEGKIRGLTISRPVQAPHLWSAVLKLMAAHHGLLFFSNDTTPRFRDLQDTLHYPIDLLRELGTPLQVNSPTDLLTRPGITEPV